MKKYLVLTLALLFGCTYPSLSKSVNEENLRFHAGEKVKITSGFYKDCTGLVEDYYHVSTDDGDGVRYKIGDVNCNSYLIAPVLFVDEDKLKEVK